MKTRLRVANNVIAQTSENRTAVFGSAGGEKPPATRLACCFFVLCHVVIVCLYKWPQTVLFEMVFVY